MSDTTAETLAERAMNTTPTKRHVELLLRTALFARITTNHETLTEALFERCEQTLDAAMTELEQIPASERDQLVREVDNQIRLRVFVAAAGLLGAAAVLDYDPDDLDPEHVALVAMLPAA